jgi:hypothetical protein
MYALMVQGKQARAACVFAKPLLESLGSGLGAHEALSLNIVAFLLVLFPEELKSSASIITDIMFRFLLRFADAGDATVPIKKVEEKKLFLLS